MTDYMRGSRRAGELLYRLGGSLIRNSALIPVIPEGAVSEGLSINELRRRSVPLSTSTLLKSIDRVSGAVGCSGELIDARTIRKRLSVALRDYRSRRTVKALREVLRAMMTLGINAFVVRADYSCEEGLRI